MNRNAFVAQLTLLSALSAGALALLHLRPEFHAYRAFSWACLALFIVLSVFMFWAGKRAALSENKNDFTTVAMGFSGGKIFLSAILILLYVELAQPASKQFVLPFFGIYTAYTIFEVYFMMRLSKLKP